MRRSSSWLWVPKIPTIKSRWISSKLRWLPAEWRCAPPKWTDSTSGSDIIRLQRWQFTRLTFSKPWDYLNRRLRKESTRKLVREVRAASSPKMSLSKPSSWLIWWEPSSRTTVRSPSRSSRDTVRIGLTWVWCRKSSLVPLNKKCQAWWISWLTQSSASWWTILSKKSSEWSHTTSCSGHLASMTAILLSGKTISRRSVALVCWLKISWTRPRCL